MIIRTVVLTFIGILLAVESSDAQGTFQNLNFELANPGSAPSGTDVPVGNALPYWSVYYGNVEQSQVGYNLVTSGSTSVSLLSDAGTIDGSYSLLLQGGVMQTVQGNMPAAASIAQTGTIPLETQYLLFKAQAGIGALDVLVGNQSVPIVPISTGVNYTEYEANISAWAGLSEQLTFSADPVGLNSWTLDDISFSTQNVPEANQFIMTGLGGTLFALYRRFAPKRK